MRDARRLRFYEDKGSCWIEVPDMSGAIIRRATCAWDQTRILRDEFAQTLREARDLLDRNGGPSDPDQAHAFFSRINDEGIVVLQRLLGDEHRRLKPLLSAAMKDVPSGIYQAADFPIVQIEMPRNFIQLEALPFIEIAEVPKFTSLEILFQTAMRFPGFSFVVQRIEAATYAGDPLLRALPQVAVKMFRHAGFHGSALEARILARDYALEGGVAWPDTADCTADAAVRAMVHHDRTFAGDLKPVLDQIHHFSCHSEMGYKDPCLELMSPDGEAFQISTRDFDRQFRLADATRDPSAPRPLAFLNACETNAPDSHCLSTWASTLVQARYRAVIATEAPAPDMFASKFSRLFYGELMAGRSVGQALQRSKWTMLERWRNPLGLIYTLFGDPDLRIG